MLKFLLDNFLLKKSLDNGVCVASELQKTLFLFWSCRSGMVKYL